MLGNILPSCGTGKPIYGDIVSKYINYGKNTFMSVNKQVNMQGHSYCAQTLPLRLHSWQQYSSLKLVFVLEQSYTEQHHNR